MKPSFLIIGSMKSGTTSLYQSICDSDVVSMVQPKESWVLIDSVDREDSERRYNDKAPSDVHSKLGECSSLYAQEDLYPQVLDNAYNWLGEKTKIIFIYRNALQRTVSHIKHDIDAGRYSEKSISIDYSNVDRCIYVSNYVDRLKPWVKKFGCKGVLVLSFERYINEPNMAVGEIADFLDISLEKNTGGYEKPAIDSKHLNSSESKRKMNSYLRSVIHSDLYRNSFRKILPDVLRKNVHTLLTGKKKGKVELPESILAYISEHTEGCDEALSEYLRINGVRHWK